VEFMSVSVYFVSEGQSLVTERNVSYKGMVRSDMSKPALIFFFFTVRVQTTKSTIKILAANTHCKYFLKIAEVTHFFCTRNRLCQEVCTILCAISYLERCNIRLG
jgi:hypothetical protein